MDSMRPDVAASTSEKTYPPLSAANGATGITAAGKEERHEASSVELVNARFTQRYALAVLVGLVPVFIAPGLWWMTVVAMLLFLALGYEEARRARMVYEFADAFYYLGFTLSIGALLAALDPFHVSARPNVVVTFHRFGLGMFTTLIGVTGRTILQAYHRLASETLDSVNRQLAEEGQRYLESIRKLNTRALNMLDGSLGEYQERVVKPLAYLGTALGQTAVIATDAVQRATEMNAAAGEAIVTIKTVSQAATETVRKAANESAAAVVSSAEQATRAIRSTGTSSVSSLQDLADDADRTRQSVVGARRQLEPLVEGPSGLVELANQTAKATRAVTSVVATDLALLEQAAKSVAELTLRLQESGTQLDSAPLRAQLTTLETALKAVTEAVGMQGNVVKTQSAVIDAQLGAAKNAAAQVNAALDEVARAVTTRLERIS